MKNIICVTIAICIVNAGLNAQGFDKKQTVNDLKSYLKDPERYYNEKNAMNDRFVALEQETNNYKKKAEEVQTELEDKDKIIADLKAENAKLKATSGNGILQARAAAPVVSTGGMVSNSPYKVQIGVYNKFSINQFLNSAKCITTSNVNGNNVYEVAGFNDVNEASMMAQELKRMGLRDAFVTKYVNGSRDLSFDATRVMGGGGYTPPAANAAYTPPTGGYTPPSTNSYAPPTNGYTPPAANATYTPPSGGYTPPASASALNVLPPATPTVNKPKSGGMMIVE
jgi:hypothetical protein